MTARTKLKSLLVIAIVALAASFAFAQSDGVAKAKALLSQYEQIPKFIAAGPPFDAKTCMAGKSIFSIPVSNAIPFAQNIEDAMKAVAKEIGFKFTVWDNQGSPSQYIQGMERAINDKYSLIDLLGGTDPRALGPQIDQATAAGIDVVASHYSGLNQAVSPKLTGNVPIDYYRGGQLLADWVIAKTNGHGNALVVVSRDGFSTAPLESGIEDEFKKNCPDCKVKAVNVAIPDWSTKIQSVVQSEILSNPKLNYVIPIYDSMSQFVVPAITITGAQNRVKIATFNGTPFVIGLIQKGQVEMDVGENLDWVGHAVMDAEMRILCGLQPVKDPKVPFYIFDASNAASAGTPPKASVGYGDAYVNGYRKLWQLQ